MRTLAFAAACLLWTATLSAQTNPCTQPLPPGTAITASSEVYATLPDHTAVVAGLPVVTEYQFGFFLPGVDPATGQPVTLVTIPKASWVLVTGTTNCYHVKPVELLAMPVNADRRGAVKARRTTPDVAESAWSAPTNPFARVGPPAVPTGARVTE